jgi:hypothetical protein
MGDAFADAATGAGDDDGFVLDPHEHSLRLLVNAHACVNIGRRGTDLPGRAAGRWTRACLCIE